MVRGAAVPKSTTSGRKGKPAKPSKPCADYPLFPHDSGEMGEENQRPIVAHDRLLTAVNRC